MVNDCQFNFRSFSDVCTLHGKPYSFETDGDFNMSEKKNQKRVIWPAHGNSNLFVRERILYLESLGGFNFEGVEKVVETCLKIAFTNLYNGRSLAQIVDLRQFELSTPDTSTALSYYYLKAITLGLRYEAVIATRPIVEEFNSKIMLPFQSIIISRCFSQLSEAISFLNSKKPQQK
jgi:hypothetical protein